MLNFNWNKRNTIIAVSIAVYALIALFINIISNNKTISSWMSNFFSVLAPLIIGAAIAYLCLPILKFFENRIFKHIKFHKLRRVLSIVTTYLLLMLVITSILLIVIPQLKSSYNDFTINLSSYTTKAINYVNRLIATFDFSIGGDQLDDYIKIEDIQAKVSEWFKDSSALIKKVGDYVINYGSSVVIGVKNIFLGLFVSIYILSSKERLAAQCKKACSAIFNKEHYESLLEWVNFTNITFGRYIKAQLLDALMVAFECGIIFSIFEIPYSVLLAFMIGVTNIIPVFGPFIGGIPAGFIVLISDPSKVIWFAILLIIIQQLDGNIVLPKLVGSTTGMTSFGVLCAITIMGGYFGIIGMILGVPVFAVAGEVIRRLVNIGLKNKGMSVSLNDYYNPGVLITNDGDGKKHEKKLIARFFSLIANLFRKLLHSKKKRFNNKKD